VLHGCDRVVAILGVVVAWFAVTAIAAGVPAASAASFTVDDFGDTDRGYGAGVCPSPCTLRDAIEAVNSGPGTGDAIGFANAGTVTLSAHLPAVTAGVVIDGGSLGDVTLDAAGFQGLLFSAGASTVRDLVLVRSASAGVWITGTARTSVLDNLIGTDALGAPGLGNAWGVLLDAPDAVVRGNVVSGNTNSGIELGDAARAVIAGNRIGLKPAGIVALGNGAAGVFAPSGLALDVTVGGILAADRNVISGNGGAGVLLNVSAPMRWTIRGNFIGTDVTGTATVPNGSSGIGIADADENLIADNVISGNAGGGISLTQNSESPTGNVISGNVIGSDAAGQLDLGNDSAGIALGAAFDNVIGPGNLVAHNSQAGVAISRANFTDSDRNRVTANRIRDNFGPGIDLDMFSAFVPNDPLDADAGPNGFQNVPLVASAVAGGGSTSVAGSLDSAPSTPYRIELFSSAACDPDGRGEGATYHGLLVATTDGAGSGSFEGDVPGDAAGVVTATATDPQGRTSEFSPCVAVTERPPTGGGGGGGSGGGGGGGGGTGGGQSPPPPPPETGETFNAGAERGKVTVRLPDGTTVALDETVQIVSGSVVDTRQGAVRLSAEGANGTIETGVFSDGLFRVTQTKGRRPVTELALVEKLAACPKRGARAAAKRKKKRRLWGDANGRYRTRGKYGNAINNGTRWLTEDRCDGTLFRVARGSIDVRRNGKRKAVRVKAGRSHLVRKPT
jgi:parallel beta-helix repeat protein